MTGTPPGWDGLLEPGERILWQGRPAGRITASGLEWRRSLFGLLFFGFAVFWTYTAATTASTSHGPIGLVMSLFGLPFIMIGLNLVGASVIWRAWVLRHSWYTLTDRRAFIGIRMLGRRSLKSWPITAQSVLDLDEGPISTIWFASGRRRRGRRRGQSRIGFEQIADGREVLRLMRLVQKGTA